MLGKIAGAVAGPLLGGLFSYQGQKAANQANLKIAREQMAHQDKSQQKSMDFSSEEAAIARTFESKEANLARTHSSTEAARNRDFQQSSARESMDWEAQQAEINRNFQQASADKSMRFSAGESKKDREFQALQAAKQMAFQEASQKMQMDFNERMSSTAIQRKMADLKAAGINPMLAHMGGGANVPSASAMSGASGHGSRASGSTASGSSARGHSASGSSAQSPSARGVSASGVGPTSGAATHFLNQLSPALSTAMQAMQTIAQIKNLDQDTKNKEATRSKIRNETVESTSRTQKNIQETKNRKLEESKKEVEANFYELVGEQTYMLNQILDSIKKITGVMPNFKKGVR